MLLLCLCMPALSESTEASFVFRNGIQFGMTMDQVESLVQEQLNAAGLQDVSEIYRDEITTEDWGIDAYSGMIGTDMDDAKDTTGYFFGTDETKGLIEIIYIVKDLTGAAMGTSSTLPAAGEELAELDYQMIDTALTEKYGLPRESSMALSPYWQFMIENGYGYASGRYSQNLLIRISHRLVRLGGGKAVLIEHVWLDNSGTNAVSYLEISETEYEYRMKKKNIQDYLNEML
ncbi:MAG: hypothetical protein E7324_10865 [Clostridiales bacterium]|nr:hypothetical protein [Clostridiales bacterium]